MSVLINLLPDLRQAKAKAARRRNLATGVSVFIWAACAVVLVLLTLSVASESIVVKANKGTIDDQQNQLRNMDGLVDAITASQHLDSLTTLYGQRTYLSHFFHALEQVSPTNLSISSLTLDDSNNLVVSGSASDMATVAKLSRAMEAENLTIGDQPSTSNQPYFTDVAIQNVDGSSGTISFTLNATLASVVTQGTTNGQ